MAAADFTFITAGLFPTLNIELGFTGVGILPT